VCVSVIILAPYISSVSEFDVRAKGSSWQEDESKTDYLHVRKRFQGQRNEF